MNKELELEAKHYSDSKEFEGYDSQMRRDTFTRYSLKTAYIAGATSKYVEKQKLEFAIEQIKDIDKKCFGGSNTCKAKIKELEQKLSEL
jgi:hypothetical protein